MPKSKNKRKSVKKSNQRKNVNEYMLRMGESKLNFQNCYLNNKFALNRGE